MENFTSAKGTSHNKQTFSSKFFFVTFTILTILTSLPDLAKARIIVGVSGTTIQLINTETLLPVSSATLSIGEAQSITFNPGNGKYYILSGITLATVNPNTGECFIIGPITGTRGSYFLESITFDINSGILYVIGNCGPSCNLTALFSVDINDAVATFVAAIESSVANGDVIAYNYDDNNIYLFTGELSLLKFNITAGNFTLIPYSGTTVFSVTGALYVGSGTFFVTDHYFTLLNNRALSITSAGFATVLTNSISFVQSGYAYYETVMPVELSSFISSVDNNIVKLNWSTSSESNNSGFDVERSTVLEQSSEDWMTVGNVKGHGTSSAPNNYEFTDRGLKTGKYKYRLKQIDFNGNYEFYNLSNDVIVVAPGQFELFQNYPNPFNPITKINYDLPFDGKVKLKIFDLSGKEVMSLVDGFQSAGYYTSNFNGSDLGSGVYFYRIFINSSEGNITATKKMLLVK